MDQKLSENNLDLYQLVIFLSVLSKYVDCSYIIPPPPYVFVNISTHEKKSLS